LIIIINFPSAGERRPKGVLGILSPRRIHACVCIIEKRGVEWVGLDWTEGEAKGHLDEDSSPYLILISLIRFRFGFRPTLTDFTTTWIYHQRTSSPTLSSFQSRLFPFVLGPWIGKESLSHPNPPKRLQRLPF